MDALNQQDIDSMLTAGSSRNRAATRRGGPAVGPLEVVPYNFIRPSLISKERRAILNAIHARVGLSLQSFLSSRLRQATDVAVVSLEQVTFGEFVMALSEPCATFVFDLGEKVSAQAAVDIGTEFAHHLVDRLFGGPGEPLSSGRALTPLEQSVLRGLVEPFMRFLQEAWGEHLPMVPVTLGFEGIPGTLQVANRDDNVLVANFEIKSGTGVGLLTVCIPLAALEGFLQEKKIGHLMTGNRSRMEDRATARRNLEVTVRQVGLPVTARLRLFGLSAAALARLVPGQVILTPHNAESDLELLINGSTRFSGRIGQHHGHFGVRIVQQCEGMPSRNPKGRVIP